MRFFLAISLLCCYFCCQAQQKYALIVAIADYPKESGWNSIHSDNDLQLLVPQFKRLGFQINTLIDKQATKKNITQDLQDLILETMSACISPATGNKWKMTTVMKQTDWTRH